MLMEPLYAIADSQTALIWTEPEITAFRSVQTTLANAPSVWYPVTHSKLRIYVDLSGRGTYGLCEFSNDGYHWFIVAHASRVWKPDEVQLDVYSRQFLAVSFVTNKFRPYIELYQLDKVIVN